MFLTGIFSWWYRDGLKMRIGLLKTQLESSADFFSIGILASTLFAPFRQISAGQVSGPFEVRFRAFIDRLISRFIGALIRGFMIVFGLIAICIQFVGNVIIIALWLAAPAFPVIGLILMVIGWMPWKT